MSFTYRKWNKDPTWRPPVTRAGEYVEQKGRIGARWRCVSDAAHLGRWSLVQPCQICRRYMHDVALEQEDRSMYLGVGQYPRISRRESQHLRRDSHGGAEGIVCTDCRRAHREPPFTGVFACDFCGCFGSSRRVWERDTQIECGLPSGLPIKVRQTIRKWLKWPREWPPDPGKNYARSYGPRLCLACWRRHRKTINRLLPLVAKNEERLHLRRLSLELMQAINDRKELEHES